MADSINNGLADLPNVSLVSGVDMISNITPSSNIEELIVLDVLKENLNAMFLVIMGAMIIFMQAGFGFLEAGSIRAKNTTNILIKNFADLTFGNNHYLYNFSNYIVGFKIFHLIVLRNILNPYFDFRWVGILVGWVWTSIWRGK